MRNSKIFAISAAVLLVFGVIHTNIPQVTPIVALFTLFFLTLFLSIKRLTDLNKSIDMLQKERDLLIEKVRDRESVIEKALGIISSANDKLDKINNENEE